MVCGLPEAGTHGCQVVKLEKRCPPSPSKAPDVTRAAFTHRCPPREDKGKGKNLNLTKYPEESKLKIRSD